MYVHSQLLHLPIYQPIRQNKNKKKPIKSRWIVRLDAEESDEAEELEVEEEEEEDLDLWE